MTIKNLDYKKFSQRINDKAYKKRFPLHAMFELTYRCNFNCIHCYNTDEQKKGRSRHELETAEVFSILEQLRDLGGFYLGFTGGEVFLRKDIWTILWHARKLGFEIVILTNGSFIDKPAADELARLRPNKVDITVHAMDKKIFEKITRHPGSYDKVFQAIELLHERKIPLGLKTCGMQPNEKEVVKVSRFARSLDVLFRFDEELLPRVDRSKDPMKYGISPETGYRLNQLCYPEMFNEYDSEGKRRETVKPPKKNKKRLFNCGAGFTDMTISPYGELNICIEIHHPQYKILKGSLTEGWEQIKRLIDNLKPPEDWACRTCSLTPYCSWCPARGYLEDGNFATCDLYSRREAEFFKRISEEDD